MPVEEIILRMQELATVPIRTEGSCVELNTELSLIVLRQVLLFH
jgi:hypothetical protein